MVYLVACQLLLGVALSRCHLHLICCADGARWFLLLLEWYVSGLYKDQFVVRYQGYLLDDVQQSVVLLIDQYGPLDPFDLPNQLIYRLILRPYSR